MKVRVGEGIILDRPVPKERNFVSFLSEYVEYTKNQESNKIIHLWTGMSIIAGALERKVWVDMGHFNTYPNLYVVIVGAPGLVKKSTATQIGMSLLREVPGVKFLPEQMTDASFLDAMERTGDKFAYQGSEISHSSAYFYGSELSATLKNSYGNIPELLTTLYDCQEKPFIKETKGSGLVHIKNPCVNLIGCTTPTWLKDSIPVDQMEGGFASRILFVIVNGKPERFIAFPERDANSVNIRKKLIEDLIMINNMRGRMTLTPEARKSFQELYQRNQLSIFERGSDLRFSGYFGRKPTMIMKCAQCISASDGESMSITADHIKASESIIEALEKEMFEGLSHVGRNPLAGYIHKAITYLAENGSVTSMGLNRMFYRDLSPEEIRSLSVQLLQLGLVEHKYVNGDSLYTAKASIHEIDWR